MEPNYSITHSRYYFIFVFLIISALLLPSCGVKEIINSLPVTPTTATQLEPPTAIPATSTPQPTILPATPTSLTVVETPTATPTAQVIIETPTAIPASSTPEETLLASATTSFENQVTNTIPTAPGEIVIAPGSTATVIKGTIQPGQVVTYTVQGYQYQPLILNVDSPKFDVTLGLIAPDGTKMFDPAKKWLNWQVPLHETGLYTIQVIGGATTEDYILTVKLPKHVYIGNGITKVTIQSATYQGFVVSYAINGNVGEILTVSLDVPSSKAYLDVFGVATGSLLSYTEKANSWTGTLSKKQLYVIEVIPRGGWTVNYTLTISFEE